MEKAELKELLKESTEKLIAQLSEILDKNSSLYNEMIILSKKYYEGKMEINLGTIKFEDWNVLKTQVDVGFLELIDRMDEPNQSRNDKTYIGKKVSIEDALEWLKNVFVNKKFSFVVSPFAYKFEENKENYTFEDKYLYDFNIKKNGNFLIKEDSFRVSLMDDLITNDFSFTNFFLGATLGINKYRVNSELIINGNFKDISSVKIEKYKDGNSINVVGVNNTNCFKIKYNIRSRQMPLFLFPKEDIYDGEKKVNEFKLYISGEYPELTKKLKNAIDYLAIHFGRKEDAF